MIGFHRQRDGANAAAGRDEASVAVLAFERVCCRDRGLVAGGRLDYLHGMTRSSVFVGLTWDALALLRAELAGFGIELADVVIVSRCLRRWGAEQVRACARDRRTPPLDGLILGFDCGPASRAPRELLERAALLPAGDEGPEPSPPRSPARPARRLTASSAAWRRPPAQAPALGESRRRL